MPSYSLGFLIVISLSSVYSSEGKLWALLVAGSNGYTNYRHQVGKCWDFFFCWTSHIPVVTQYFEILQADICHAYQIFRHNNVPAENIITMMYDDIANNSE